MQGPFGLRPVRRSRSFERGSLYIESVLTITGGKVDYGTGPYAALASDLPVIAPA